MLIGYLVSGIVGGLAVAAIAMTFGNPGMLVVMIYSVAGLAAMVGFGVVALRPSSRG